MGWSYTLNELAAMLEVDAPGNETEVQRVSTDTRKLEPGDVFFAITGEQFDGNKFVDDAFQRGAAACVCLEPHDSGPCLVVPDVLVALQTFARKHRERYEIYVIAITGSCGKTSSKDLVAAVLSTRYNVVKTQGNLNNEIGLPLSLLQIDDTTEVAVIEMGANHRGEIAHLCTLAKPTESAITMVAEAHLEGFGSIEDIAAAKSEIVSGLSEHGRFYMNTDDPLCVKAAKACNGEIVRYGSEGDVVLEACAFNEAGEMDLRIHPVGELVLPLHARAHATNVLLAIAIGLKHGVVSFEEPLRRACNEASRFRVEKIGALEVIDDTYNSNPGSLRAALEALRDRPVPGKRMVALGDMLELGPRADELHEIAGNFAGECGVGHLFVRGAHAEATAQGAKQGGVDHTEVIDAHRDMAMSIVAKAQPGDTLLVKGSRGMAMENVIQCLRDFYQSDQANSASRDH